MLKDIVVRTMMLQSYLVTKKQRQERLSDEKVFETFVIMLYDAIHGKAYYGYRYPIIKAVKVRSFQAVLFLRFNSVVYGHPCVIYATDR